MSSIFFSFISGIVVPSILHFAIPLEWISNIFVSSSLVQIFPFAKSHVYIPPFLSEFLSADDLIHILSITTLNISLRLELIKFFRMIYIDLAIDLNKLEQYRYNFQQELDADVAEVGDSLIPIEQMKIFLFLQRLLKVSNYNFYSQESQKEFDKDKKAIINFSGVEITTSPSRRGDAEENKIVIEPFDCSSSKI